MEIKDKDLLGTASAAINLIQTILSRSPSYNQEKKNEFYKIISSLSKHLATSPQDLGMITLLQDERDNFLKVFADEIANKNMILIEEKYVSKGMLNGQM